MKPSRIHALAMSGLFGALVIACEDTVRVEAYLDDEPRPMFAGVRVLRGAGSTGKDRLELVASDRPIDCSKLGEGRLVLQLALYDWRPGSQQVDLTVLTSDAAPARARWTIYSSYPFPPWIVPGETLLSLSVLQETAPTRRGDRARFVLPLIRVATLVPLDPRSCCAQHDSDDRAPICSEQCPLPTRIERLDTALDVELCDDIDWSTIERQR